MSGISFHMPQAARFARRWWRPGRRSLALAVAAPVVALTTATLTTVALPTAASASAAAHEGLATSARATAPMNPPAKMAASSRGSSFIADAHGRAILCRALAGAIRVTWG